VRRLFPSGNKLPRFSKYLFAFLVLVAFFIPTPYVLLSPGTPQNILNSAITITGAQVFPTTGKMAVTSVMVTNPDSYMTGFDILYGWVTAERAVLPRVEVYPDNESTEESIKQGAADMQASQASATTAALTLLGYKGETKLIVNSINEKTDSFKKLKPGDQIIEIDSRPLTSTTQLLDYLKSKKPGEVITLKILREPAAQRSSMEASTQSSTNSTKKLLDELTVEVKLSARDDNSAFIGIIVETVQNFPVTVKIKLAETGGPSGGLIFALGIIEKLQSENLTRGRNIAGTGTITDSGEVGPIGGITEKIIGAKKDGVEIFLAPVENCLDISTPQLLEGIKVVPVATLTQALEVLRAPDGAELASCPTR
jgi:PDZ domain-containing protein